MYNELVPLVPRSETITELSMFPKAHHHLYVAEYNAKPRFFGYDLVDSKAIYRASTTLK